MGAGSHIRRGNEMGELRELKQLTRMGGYVYMCEWKPYAFGFHLDVIGTGGIGSKCFKQKPRYQFLLRLTPRNRAVSWRCV